MNDDLIAGFCRFSYLGRSDWAAVRGRPTDTVDWDARAAQLYDPDRLSLRFAVFETICLPSILAQPADGFVFVLVTSPEMPAEARDHLADLCAPAGNIRIVVSAERSLGAALGSVLTELTESAPRNLIQFRLDDDDAIAADFVTRLRRHSAALADHPQFAVSFAHSLALALYPGKPVTPLMYDLPFLGAGLACRLQRPSRTIYSMGHFGMQRRMTHIVDRGSPGAFVLKWPSDSRSVPLDRLPPELSVLKWARARPLIARSFPWLERFDFDALAGAVAELDAPGRA